MGESTEKGLEGTFWGDGNIVYLIRSLGCKGHALLELIVHLNYVHLVSLSFVNISLTFTKKENNHKNMLICILTCGGRVLLMSAIYNESKGQVDGYS